LLKKAVIFIIVLLVTVSIITYLYVYKDHRDISNTTTFKSFTATELMHVFTDANPENDKEVLDQVIEITGEITDLSKGSITVNNNIFIILMEEESVQMDQLITIKGRCLGYDDLLEEIKIDQASLITNN
jgi:hypothetical protein